MAVEITMPQLSDTMSQGTILSWLKKEGDKVKRGDALAEVETDKANLEIEAFHEGVLQKILIPAGTAVEVGAVIALIGREGEVAGTTSVAGPVVAQSATQAVVESPAMVSPGTSTPVTSTQVAQSSSSSFPVGVEYHELPEDQGIEERLKASPLAKNIAQAHNVDLREIKGTGEGGRIVRRDVESVIGVSVGPVGARPNAAFAASVASSATNIEQVAPTANLNRPPADSTPRTSVPGVQPLSKMRATIAQRMVESTTSIPHFYTTVKIVVDELKRVRSTLKALPQYEGITYNHLIIKAVASAMKKVPRINSSYSAEGIIQPANVNVGIVTAVNDGLLIPVLKDAQELSLSDIVGESKGLVQRARAGKPKPTDLVGGTFSISNMGLYEVEQFTAIISPGQGAILAVSPIQEEAIAENGVLRAGLVMRLTLSVDHRIIDGVMCGEFLTELKKLLEEPILLLA